MPASLPVCTERTLAPHLHDEAVRRAVDLNFLNERESPTRFWMSGMTIRVRFLDGDPALQARVASAAQEWRRYADIRFSFEDAPDAEIRISFMQPALWAYVGTDALLVPQDEPTLCLGALLSMTDDAMIVRVVLHEFGHVLGLTHETLVDLGVPAPVIDPTLRRVDDLFDDVLSEEGKESIAEVYRVFMASLALEGGPPEEAALESIKPEAEPELVEELIRLDVAHPEQAFVDEPFDLAVAVRQRDAPVLAIEDLPKTISEEGTVFRAPGEEVIQYRIEVIGADCDVQPPHYVILLRRGENAKPRFFQITAHRAGKRTLVVNAYQEDGALAAQTRMRIEVQMPVQGVQPLSGAMGVPEMNVELTPKEVEQLQEALLSAFNRSELEQITRFGLGVKYDDIVSPGSLRSEVFELLEWAVARNKIGALLKQAREDNPDNVKLREFVEQIAAK